jgi:hypothetical protein
LTEEEKIVYEWQYQLDGGFRHTLMDAIMKADDENLDKLALVYPHHVNGYKRYAHEKGWWESVQRKMGL